MGVPSVMRCARLPSGPENGSSLTTDGDGVLSGRVSYRRSVEVDSEDCQGESGAPVPLPLALLLELDHVGPDEQ